MSQTSVEDYSGKRTAEIVGISYRQLDYWARTDLIRPSVSDASGSGSRRRYSYQDLLELKVIKNLLDSGIRLEAVRKVFGFLREDLNQDIATANLIIRGETSVLVKSDDDLLDALHNGQGVLSILPLGDVLVELDTAIVELYPSAESAILDETLVESAAANG
ncbi:MAG: MerR family transcriptional regulator [Acidimicrobiales bacterium]|jgi:DNA-binding transcriptional MerR regulator